MDKEKNQKILVVDDEELINKAYAQELRDDGFIVITAKDGKEGLDLALSEKPDLILLDILMPIMDGLVMIDALRNTNEYGQNVPIIFLTNLSASDEKIVRAITVFKPAYYLIKSDWDLDRIVGKIKEQLAVK